MRHKRQLALLLVLLAAWLPVWAADDGVDDDDQPVPEDIVPLPDQAAVDSRLDDADAMAAAADDDLFAKARARLNIGQSGTVGPLAALTTAKRREEVRQGLQMLAQSASMGHEQARLLQADIAFFGMFEQPQRLHDAFTAYTRLAEELGTPRAQFMLGFLHAVGGDIVPEVERDQAKAFIYYSFAASSGDVWANMALGYRYLAGIGVDKSCQHAVDFYHQAADVVAAEYESRPPGWHGAGALKQRLASDAGGVFGPGASGAGAPDVEPINIAHTQEDVVQFYHFNAERGDAGAQLVLGQLYYQGTATVTRNFERAFRYLRAAAVQLPRHGGASVAGTVHALEGSHQTDAMAMAAALLGQMYWRGEGVAQDNVTALSWFHRAAEHGNAAGLNSLGVMYQQGIVVTKNPDKAVKLFQRAAELDNADAQVNLALILLRNPQPDYASALKFLTLATKQGHLLGLYHLGHMYATGKGVMASCTVAMTLYKTAVERHEMGASLIADGYQAHQRRDYDGALLAYLVAGELGFEVAHSNAAWLLDTGKATLSWNKNEKPADKEEREESSAGSHSMALALVLWNRAANLGNVDARIKMGDYHYYGRGTAVDYNRAVAYYQAAESEHSAMAMYNLGFMHERGLGIAQDLHLAKRYYDRALETNPEAHLPVTLSLLSLRVQHFFHWLRHGGPFSLDSPAASSDGNNGDDQTLQQRPHGQSGLLDDQHLAEILRVHAEGGAAPAGQPERNDAIGDIGDDYAYDNAAVDDGDVNGDGLDWDGAGGYNPYGGNNNHNQYGASDSESVLIIVLLAALGFLMWARRGAAQGPVAAPRMNFQRPPPPQQPQQLQEQQQPPTPPPPAVEAVNEPDLPTEDIPRAGDETQSTSASGSSVPRHRNVAPTTETDSE